MLLFYFLEVNYFCEQLASCLLEPVSDFWRRNGAGFLTRTLLQFALEERAALCKLLLLAPASWNCSLAVQWQQIICVMDLLFGMCENSAFRLIDRTELKHQCYSNDTSKVDSVHGYKIRYQLFKLSSGLRDCAH